ncbi:putative heparinase superfamily protein [Spirosoma lacussanchae]
MTKGFKIHCKSLRINYMGMVEAAGQFIQEILDDWVKVFGMKLYSVAW